jgi:hypothetical protein
VVFLKEFRARNSDISAIESDAVCQSETGKHRFKAQFPIICYSGTTCA